MNCQWNCLITADWHELKSEEAWKVVACPTEIKAGTKIYIEDYGIVTCHDRGARITKDKDWIYHLDLRAWIGEQWVLNIIDPKQETYVYNPWIRRWYLID